MGDNWLRPLRDLIGTGDFSSLSNIYIAGIEVTQAIQHCNASEHLTDPSDRGPDNSITLVSDKPAYVRVYVRTLIAPVAGVTGTIKVQRRRRGVWVDSGELAQDWAVTISAEPDLPYWQERGQLGSSLNFLIPAAEMRGMMRLRAEVHVPGRNYHATGEVLVVASLNQTLRVRGIPIRYLGPDSAGNQIDLAAPTLSDFQATATLALTMFPVSHVPEITLAGTFTLSNPLIGNITTGSGSAQCPTSWQNLLFWLGIAKTIDGNRPDCLYYALLPGGIPVGDAAGCGGGGGAGAGFDGSTRTMAHELGHVLGLSHAPCGLMPGDNGDVSYPAYEPYDSEGAKKGSIGEFGIDVNMARVHAPSASRDFMAYCSPRWISPYHYRKLIEHPMLNPRWIPTPPDELPPYDYDWPPRLPVPDPGWDRRRDQELVAPLAPRFVISGIFRDEQIEVHSVLRLETRPSHGAIRLEGGFAELLDAHGQRLERVPIMRLPLHACRNCERDCKCGEASSNAGLVQAFLPDRDDAKSVRLVWRDEEVWSRKAAPSKPVIRGLRAKIGDGQLHMTWESRTSSDHAVERALRWSADAGETWEVLALSLPSDEAILPLEVVPSGDIVVQSIVSDGFSTAVSDPVPVRVPARAPTVTILWPRPDLLPTSGIARLWGVGTASNGRLLSGKDLHWELDGETVATGSEAWIRLPKGSGEHRLTLRGKDGRRESETTTTFIADEIGRD